MPPKNTATPWFFLVASGDPGRRPPASSLATASPPPAVLQ